MSQDNDIVVITTDLETRTRGLRQRQRPELRVRVSTPDLLVASEAFVRHLIAYVQDGDVQLQPGETIAYGYWLTRLHPSDDGFLDVWEYNSDATEFVPGADLTLTYWRDQHEVCQRFGVPCVPPRPDKLAAVSVGVLTGDPLEGVRYPSPDHMSGWWFTTDRYDGNTRSLTLHHLYHVTAARPDVARYIALPVGFRFSTGEQDYVWFDEKIASSQSEDS